MNYYLITLWLFDGGEEVHTISARDESTANMVASSLAGVRGCSNCTVTHIFTDYSA